MQYMDMIYMQECVTTYIQGISISCKQQREKKNEKNGQTRKCWQTLGNDWASEV